MTSATNSAIAPAAPIAIVGMGCRFPGGVTDPASFWRLLAEGRQAIGEVPPDRWSLAWYFHPDRAASGAMASRWGGFIDTLAQFDAAFWGVSPREATRMDPQQRWLLEVAWEAIEDAGLAPSRLRGSATGVFVGIAGNDYSSLQLGDAEGVDAYTNSGNTASIAANRISYLLDLRGPSLSVDTACSSSLVAVALACDSLRAGVCETALAGGVNALISPHVSVGFSKASMLSATGRCHAFDARADGYVRAEGAGLVLLKPLAQALADGNRIYAVIRGTAVNQDGHTSSMTVPSIDGQAVMLQAAYEQAGIAPSRVAYVEAHGTGTPVGDPIETAALGRVLGAGRPDNEPCLIGSVKTNIGHLESASGIAGLIKAALVASHGAIPASLNFERPNPDIPFDQLRLAVAAEAQPLISRDDEPAIVGVNSFGFGGTNAHVVLQSPPPVTTGVEPERALRPLALAISARDERALRGYAESYRHRLRHGADDANALCAAAGAHKEHHPHRLVVRGDSRAELVDRLRRWLRDGQATGASCGRARPAGAPVFVFTGQGAQWWAMGRQLIAREPLVRKRLDAIDALLAPLTGWSLVGELHKDEATSQIDRTDIAQPALFALQVALVDLWRSWGIAPAAVIGHSVGEVAAAYCAGAYSLDDAVRIIFHRSRLQHTTHGQGRMLAAALSRERAAEVIGSVDGVELAAVNSPQLVTLSGSARGLEEIERLLVRDGVFARWVRIAYAFHSAQMDPLRDDLLEALAALRPRSTTVPFVSTVTGTDTAGETLDAHYWWTNVREPVRFADGIATLARAGHHRYLEIGPHPALESAVTGCLAAADTKGLSLHSLRRDADDSSELFEAVSSLYVHGAEVNWAAINQAWGAGVALPTYPWTRETFWHESAGSAARRLGSPDHPLLGRRLDAPTPTWETALDLKRLPYLSDHRIWNRVVFPGAGFAEMALAVAALLFPDDPNAVEDLTINAPLFLTTESPTTVRITFDPADRSLRIHGSPERSEGWELHASCTLARTPADPGSYVAVAASADRLRTSGRHYSHHEYRATWASRGYQFGPNFQLVDQLWRSSSETLIEIAVPDTVASDLGHYRFHPAVLDACFHAFLGLQMGEDGSSAGHLYLPERIGRIAVYGTPVLNARLVASARLLEDDGASLLADIHVRDANGIAVADILRFRVVRVEQPDADPVDNHYYRFEWEPHHLLGAGAEGACGFPSGVEIAAAVRGQVADLREPFALDAYRQRKHWMRHAVGQIVVDALAALGWRAKSGDEFSFAPWAAQLGIPEEHRRAARNLLEDLTAAGWLEALATDSWRVRREPERIDHSRFIDELEAAEPAAGPELGLLRQSAHHLDTILAGQTDATSLLFPGGSPEYVERFYRDGGAFPAHLEVFRRVLGRALAGLPSGRTVRVLEIGAGTGTLTSAALQALPEGDTEYWFTDIGPAFLAAGRTRFARHSGLEFRVFDVERRPGAQGIPEGYFDVVVASNVLHATADLRETVGNVRRCLAPGGTLVVVELVDPRFALVNVTFGLLRGWWRGTDRELRPDTPLLERRQWLRLLSECGFADAATVSCTVDEQDAEHATFVASAVPEAVAATSGPAAPPRQYLVLADRGGLADSLATALRQRGHDCRVIDARASLDVPEIRRAVQAASLSGVIHCRSLDHPPAGALDLESLRAAQDHGLMSAMHVIQAVADRSVPVWFVTRGVFRAQPQDLVSGLASSPLVGLTRVANNEHECRFFVVDLDEATADTDVGHLLEEVTLPSDGEFEVAYRGGRRHVPRLRRLRAETLPARTYPAVAADGAVRPFRLESHKPGVLTNLAWHETSRAAPRRGEIEVRVHAGGINFRDVMKALGTHPGRPQDLEWFGDDFAGVVERVGEGVERWRPGDRVAGLAPYAFRAFARTDARFVFGLPPSMRFEDAATIPTVFLTAHHALTDLARLQPGERVLIHAGAGGVGLAAIQVAQRLSLEIFATAGTPEKRDLLRSLGVPHVMNSRTLAFADEIMALTGGRGVDAVLNSLAGDFIPRSLSVLAPFGRFIEIGKIDIYRNATIGLQALRQNISYVVLDLTQHVREKPAFIERLFADLSARFLTGEYRPLPSTVFPADEVVAAFRHMAQGKHVGKNVLTLAPSRMQVAFPSEPANRFRSDATYLVVGGAGGVGLRVARWIADSGGRHLVLMSRSGPDAESRAIIEELGIQGISVVDARGDVADSIAVDRVIADIAASGPPLRGVFHAATVMDDEFIAQQDRGRFNRVLEPKMAGAWNLHVATSALPLDHFVCFSSFSTVIALPKQASYDAGNLFLDQLAHYRHALGLPALAVNFGAILGAGFVERQRRDGDSLTRLGFGAFQIDETLRVLERLMPAEVAQVSAARIDWGQVLRLSPLVATAATYQTVRQTARDSMKSGSLLTRLRVTTANERPRIMEDFVVTQVAAVFGMAEDRVDRVTPLTNLGLDSLMILELTNRVERELGLRIPMASLLGGPTVVELSATVLRLLTPSLAEAASDREDDRIAASDTHTTGTDDVTPVADHLVLLQRGSDRAPIFAFHPAGGGVHLYGKLVRHLPNALVYGVESRLKRGATREYDSLDVMVERYTAAVRSTSHGPHRLVGFSLGGYLAARVAELLEAAGDEVHGVGVIDWDIRRGPGDGAQRERLIRMSVGAYRVAHEEAGLVRPLPDDTVRREVTPIVDAILGGRDGVGDLFFQWVQERQLVVSPAVEMVARQQMTCFEEHCLLLREPLPIPRLRTPLGVWRARHGIGSDLASWEHRGGMDCEYTYDGDHHGWTQPGTLEPIARQLADFFARAAVTSDAATPGARP